MRTKNSLKNIAISLSLGIIAMISGFVLQRFFVESLGIEYVGVNGLFTNVISILSLVELGFGAAIIYHLYEPLHKKDSNKISSIMRFYKIGYRIIAASVIILGGLALPFLPYLVEPNAIKDSLYIIYILFIANTVTSYLLSYKRSILYADQKNYIINAVHIIGILILNILQILVLVLTKNYYLFLVLKIAVTLAENLILNHIVNKRYNLDKNAEPLSKEFRSDIIQKIKGLAFHKVGEILVMGSTNVIISVLLGVATVGLYANYLLIQTAITTLFSQISTAIKASVGNLLVDVGGEKSFTTFKRIQFANQILSVLAVSVFFVTSSTFITIWIGSEYLFSLHAVAALSLALYLRLTRSVFANFKEAAGVFYEDRYVPLIESAINVIVSIALIQIIGVTGAFIGVALSSLVLHFYSYPKYVYQGIFKRSHIEYTLHFLKNLLVSTLSIALAYYLASLLRSNSLTLSLLYSLIVAILVPSVVIWVISRKSEEYSYYKKMIGKLKITKKK